LREKRLEPILFALECELFLPQQFGAAAGDVEAVREPGAAGTARGIADPHRCTPA
jgi:hypothetical protein